MRSWTTREAKLVMEWARIPAEERSCIEEVAGRLGRTPAAVQEFLRRTLPPGQRPWAEKPRWGSREVEMVENGNTIATRSRVAIRKYLQRHPPTTHSDQALQDDNDRSTLTVSQVAQDIGLSRATVYRLLKSGVLRRFRGGVAETSFSDLLREHPEAIPYSRLPRDQKEWLVLNGYQDPSINVKRPSTKGLLD
jgi:hypothetical protein